MTQLKPFTLMHLKTASRMPRKAPQIWLGEKVQRKCVRQSKAERGAIATYYRLLRSGSVDGYGPKQASIAHRYGVVVSGAEAKARIKNMTG